MCDSALPKLVDATAAAAYFGLRVGTFRDLARRRNFPHYRVGRAIRWDLSALVELLREEGDER